MKKSTLSLCASVFLASSLFSNDTTMEVVDGWNLKGASTNIDVSAIQCAKTIWKYDTANITEPWSLYLKDDTSGNNYGYNSFSQINAGEGFWVLGDNCSGDTTNPDTQNPDTVYDAYGKAWVDVKSGEKYTDNSVTFTASTDNTKEYFTLSTTKKTGIDSRAEIRTNIDNDIQAMAKIKVTSLANKAGAKFRVYAYGASYAGYTKPYFIVSVDVYGSKIFAKLFVGEEGSSDATVIAEETLAQGVTNLDNTINLIIKLTDTGIVVAAKDADDDSFIGEKKTLATTGITNLNGFNEMVFRSSIYDIDNDAGDSHSFEVLGTETLPVLASLVETKALSTLFANGTTTYLFNTEEDTPWYDKIVGTSTGFTMNSYDYNAENNSFEDDGSEIVTNSGSDEYTFDDGSVAKVSIDKTLELDESNGTFLNYIRFEIITASTTYETDVWDWSPTYWDGTNNVQVTTNAQLLKMFLTNDNYIGGSHEPAMFDGNDGDTSGNMVKGYHDGTYHDNCGEGDCKKIVRSDEVIGTWSIVNSSEGVITVVLENEEEKLSIIKEGSEYKVQSQNKDKVGAIFHDKLLSGNITEDKVKEMITPDDMSDNITNPDSENQDTQAPTSLSAAISGKEIVTDDKTKMHFYADGTYFEAGSDNEGSWECTGKWKEFSGNTIGATCDGASSPTPVGTVSDDEILLVFGEMIPEVGDSLVSKYIEQEGSTTISEDTLTISGIFGIPVN